LARGQTPNLFPRIAPSRKWRRMPELAASTSLNESEKNQMPTMGFLDHLEELRKRLVYSIIAIVVGFFACWGFAERIYAVMQRPIMEALQRNGLSAKLVYVNPTEPFNLYLKVGMLAGLFVASPFVLYQIWCFISPGLYRNEKRYVMPFMASTVALFVAGGYFGYKIVLPQALVFLIGYGKDFQPMITLSEYSSLFLTIIVGLGVIFEMPILVFFLALMGIVTSGWMWKNIRYAILAIFVIAAIITPTPDILNMCIFAAPMVGLYILSTGIAYLVHPDQRDKRAAKKS
jgi:sec-independent protein translocase protein TatC